MAAIKVNVSIDEALLRRMDAYADENGMTRSGLFCMAVRQYLDALEMMPATKNMLISLTQLAQKSAGGQISDEELKAQLDDIDTAYNRMLNK